MVKIIHQNVNDEAIHQWVLERNENIPIMTKDNIITDAVNPGNSAIEISDMSNDVPVTLATQIKHVEAINSFSICIQWEEQARCTFIEMSKGRGRINPF